MTDSAATIEQAQEELTPHVMALPGVAGIAIGDCEGKPCIKVLVVSRSPARDSKIPSSWRGFDVRVEEVGEIRAPRPPSER